MLKKLILVASAVTLLLISNISCDNSLEIVARPGTEAHMELTKPSITEWAYQVKTFSYTYLTLYLTKNPDNSYTLKTYYVYTAKGKWEFHKDTITLDPKIYGYILITEAPDYEIN
jgi:hypothetical protein